MDVIEKSYFTNLSTPSFSQIHVELDLSRTELSTLG